MYIFNSKVQENGEKINEKLVYKLEDENFVLTKSIELPPIEDDTSNSGGLDSGNNYEELKQIDITLERNKKQNREVVITLSNLKEIINIKSSNSGLIEIVSVDGDKVTIRVNDGEPNDYFVISASYTPGGSKLVDMKDYANYFDIYGYKGTLNRYLLSYRAPETKRVLSLQQLIKEV